jgi:hypothetical protein
MRRAAGHRRATHIAKPEGVPMGSHDEAGSHPGHAAHHPHGVGPIDESYRLVVRTILWVIAGLVSLGFAIWWGLN